MKVWIFEENLRPLLEFASGLIGYEFDDLDWDAVTIGLRETDVEKHVWFEYPLAGDQRLPIKAALDPGSSVVFVEIDAESDFGVRLGVATDLMSTYSVARKHSGMREHSRLSQRNTEGMSCDICGQAIDGDSSVVLWAPNDGEGVMFYEPFLEDLRTSWPEVFSHPACYANRHSIKALLSLVHEHEKQQRMLTWRLRGSQEGRQGAST